MTEEQLERANKLKRDIDKLSSFIFMAIRDGFWEKITYKRELRIFTTVIPFLEEKEEGYILSKELTFKILGVLKDQVSEWEKELKNI
ncbi:hypothetical protein [Lederbergia galactosidilytica]|uniref:Uncharacterized protein n=1 Tax=Lederbergia galactosidilytica TaxID=217031 RepID=A0A177ZQ01_9BACI|nr:hypothetical protein [Lederbergia galactosidilytica]OAK70081.1 hypothetical protein ABB05_12935 [Lederbergia galactosidilytica]